MLSAQALKCECIRTRTTDTRRLNLKFFEAQIQIPLPNKYLGVGYKGLVCRNNGWIMENMDKELTVPKWAENTPNASKNFSPKCLPKPKSSRFLKKKLSLGVRSPCFIWWQKWLLQDRVVELFFLGISQWSLSFFFFFWTVLVFIII